MNNKDWLIISVSTLITVMAWIAFDVYHAAVTRTITEVQQRLILPLNPKLDAGIVAKIRERHQL